MKYLGVKTEGRGLVIYQSLASQLEEYARRDHLHDIADGTGAISQEAINDEFDKLKSEIETLKYEIATLKENSGRVKNDRTDRYLDVWVGPEAIKPDSTNKLVFVEKE